MKTSDESIQAQLSARYYLYTLFRSLFGQEPSVSMVGAIEPEMVEDAFALVGAEGGTLLVDAVCAAGKTDDEELVSAYTKTLVGPGKLPASPWETVYLTGQGALFQRETLDVRNAYRAQGLLPELYPSVADDHIALECTFMAELAKRALESYEAGDIERTSANLLASKEFLRQHLNRWIPAYASDLEAAEAYSLYVAAARALTLLVERDEALLGLLT